MAGWISLEAYQTVGASAGYAAMLLALVYAVWLARRMRNRAFWPMVTVLIAWALLLVGESVGYRSTWLEMEASLKRVQEKIQSANEVDWSRCKPVTITSEGHGVASMVLCPAGLGRPL